MTTLFNELMAGLDEVDAFLAGNTDGYKVHLPAEVDVKGIRKRLKMTQARFSDTFGFSLDAVKHWEGGRRTPEALGQSLSDGHRKESSCRHYCPASEDEPCASRSRSIQAWRLRPGRHERPLCRVLVEKPQQIKHQQDHQNGA